MSETKHTPDARVPLPALFDAATEAVLAEFRPELAACGHADIRSTHGCVFRFVRSEGMRLTDLARLGGITKQSAGELVDDLVDLGYVERTQDPLDGRAKLIRLTKRGAEAQAVALKLFAELEARWAERFGADRLADLRELLEEIIATEAPEKVPELAGA